MLSLSRHHTYKSDQLGGVEHVTLLCGLRESK